MRSNLPRYMLLLLLLLVSAVSIFVDPVLAALNFETATATYQPYFITSTPYPTLACPTDALLQYPTNTTVPYTPVIQTNTPEPTLTYTPSSTPIPALVILPISGQTHSWNKSGGSSWQDGHIIFQPNFYGPVIGVGYTVSGDKGSCTFKRMDPRTVNGGPANPTATVGGDRMWPNSSDNLPTGQYISMPGFNSSEYGLTSVPATVLWANATAQLAWLQTAYPGATRQLDIGLIANQNSTPAIDMNWELGFNCSGDASVNINSLVGYGHPVMTGTPIPTQATGCSGLFPVPTPQDVGITLPTPVIGATTCFVLVPAIHVAIPDFLVPYLGEGIDYDGLQVCFRAISFGYLDLGVTQLDLDVIALILGGIALFRWLMRTAT